MPNYTSLPANDPIVKDTCYVTAISSTGANGIVYNPKPSEKDSMFFSDDSTWMMALTSNGKTDVHKGTWRFHKAENDTRYYVLTLAGEEYWYGSLSDDTLILMQLDNSDSVVVFESAYSLYLKGRL